LSAVDWRTKPRRGELTVDVALALGNWRLPLFRSAEGASSK
jgi:hypothetical protein